MTLLARMASALDNADWRRRALEARSGWASKTRDDIQFYDGATTLFRYRERGQGEPIVFLADPPVTLEMYDELLAIYGARFRVIAFEAPAMGFSVAKSGAALNFRGLNDAIIEFLEEVVAAPAILAFSCVAGLGAVDIAGRRPDLVARLALIQTPSWSGAVDWKRTRDPKQILSKPFIGQWAMERLKASRAPIWFDLALGKRDAMQTFCACASETIRHGAGWGLATAFQLYLTNERPALAPIEQPILSIWGRADRSHAATDPHSSGEHGANIRFVDYSDLGHFPELEDAPRVFRAICDFAHPSS